MGAEVLACAARGIVEAGVSECGRIERDERPFVNRLILAGVEGWVDVIDSHGKGVADLVAVIVLDGNSHRIDTVVGVGMRGINRAGGQHTLRAGCLVECDLGRRFRVTAKGLTSLPSSSLTVTVTV